MSFETINVGRSGAVYTIALARPERLNAINAQMVAELNAAMTAAERDEDVRAILLHGEGRAFCAGFDLKEGTAQTRKGSADWREVYRRDLDVIMRFWRSPLPTVAAVHGYALAGGCELAMACDVTVAASDARFGEPELRFASGIAALLLPWLANPKRAKEMLLTGNDRIAAEEARELGIVNRVVPEGEHVEQAMATARTMAVMDRTALGLTKQAINRSYDIMGMQVALEAGLDAGVQIECAETPERSRFNEIARRNGLKAAVAWRERRFADNDDNNDEDNDETR
jgi:enoyl-CoA hydratase/carnithine racemase